MEAMLATLQQELKGADPILEVGAGTGRLSIPLAQIGFHVFGVDLSGPMLARLIEKAGDGPRPEVVVGDATRLPFRSDAFGGALLFHVLHLVPDWPHVLHELDRVVRPGGAVVIGLGSADGDTDPAPGDVGRRVPARHRHRAAVPGPAPNRLGPIRRCRAGAGMDLP
jgi:ubiquinone/menaquinone biosynthesis C-methylase UbiE